MRDARGERSVIRVHRAATDASTNSLSSSTLFFKFLRSCVAAAPGTRGTHLIQDTSVSGAPCPS